jgi:5-methylthioadenosine/S-adenosylhomocysteine deaminase
MPEEFLESPEQVVSEYRKLYDEWNGKGEGRLRTWIGPVNLVYNTEESLTRLKGLADKTGMGFHTHVAEDMITTEKVKERFGKGYIEVFHDVGILGPRFQSAHSIYISDKEIQLLAKTGATAVHNAAGNMLLCNGVAPVVKMKEAGVNIAVGSDTRLDIFAAMKFAACLQKLVNRNPLALTARDVLRMATINGARAYGMEAIVGSLKPGKKADITIVDLKKSYAAPYSDPIIAMVYYLNGSDVDTVIIDGEVVMRNRVIETIDEVKTVERVQEAALNLTSRMQASSN